MNDLDYARPARNKPTQGGHMAKNRITVKTPLFRGSFVYLTKPKTVDKEDGSQKQVYSIFIPLKKDAKSTKALIADLDNMVAACTTEKFGKAIPRKLLKDFPLKDGDEMDNEQFHGFWCINAASNFKPSVVDKHGETLEGEEEAYSGAWYKVKLSAWAWEFKKRRGVSLNIESAILLKDDKRFGGGSDAKEDFADEVEEDDGEDSEDDKIC